MDLTHTINENVLVVKLEGSTLDATQTQNFKESLTEMIEQSNLSCVVIDLSQVTFIDSSGLGVFLSVLRLLSAKQGDLRLAAMSEPVRAVFQVVRMHKLFSIFDSVSAAVDSFASAGQSGPA